MRWFACFALSQSFLRKTDRRHEQHRLDAAVALYRLLERSSVFVVNLFVAGSQALRVNLRSVKRCEAALMAARRADDMDGGAV